MVRRFSRRKLARQERQNDYVNPIERAQEYQRIMQTEGLKQRKLAAKLGISRVRVNQYLALLKLSEERQVEILKYGEEQMITERTLRTRKTT